MIGLSEVQEFIGRLRTFVVSSPNQRIVISENHQGSEFTTPQSISNQKHGCACFKMPVSSYVFLKALCGQSSVSWGLRQSLRADVLRILCEVSMQMIFL